MQRIFCQLVLSVTLAVSAPALAADKSYGNAVISEVTAIYDGDTITVNIKGWPAIIGERISVRIAHIDTPEMKGQCQAEKDKARLAKQLVVTTLREAKRIELRDIRRDKYFRILADVYADGKSVAEALVKQGLARPYEGEHKAGWCD
jgi:micrococcal nuclease